MNSHRDKVIIIPMKFLTNLFLLSFLTSCSLFKVAKLSDNLAENANRICLSAEGKGRITVKNQKYVFGFESALYEDDNAWKLFLNFPLRKTESFEIDWSENNKVKFKSSLEDKLLKESKGVNPKSIKFFTHYIGILLKDIVYTRTHSEHLKKSPLIWSKKGSDLIAATEKKSFNAQFTNLMADSYFGLIKIEYKDIKKDLYRMELIVRKCFEGGALK